MFPVFTSAASDKKLASESVTGEFTIASTHTFTHHHTTILSQLQQVKAPPPAKRRRKEPVELVMPVELRRSKRLQKL